MTSRSNWLATIAQYGNSQAFITFYAQVSIFYAQFVRFALILNTFNSLLPQIHVMLGLIQPEAHLN